MCFQSVYFQSIERFQRGVKMMSTCTAFTAVLPDDVLDVVHGLAALRHSLHHAHQVPVPLRHRTRNLLNTRPGVGVQVDI